MNFHVGPVMYRLILADQRLADEANNEIEGRALEGPRLIVISPSVEIERRAEVVLHELLHCFEFHFPAPHDAEERAQFFATVNQQFESDLDAQGGRAALLGLPVTRISQTGRLRASRSERQMSKVPMGMPDRMTCSACDSEIMCGSITNAEPFTHEYTARIHVQRHMVCECCGTLTVWQETATPDGLPTGEIIAHPAPRMLKGLDASTWLASQRAVAQAV